MIEDIYAGFWRWFSVASEVDGATTLTPPKQVKTQPCGCPRAQDRPIKKKGKQFLCTQCRAAIVLPDKYIVARSIQYPMASVGGGPHGIYPQ